MSQRNTLKYDLTRYRNGHVIHGYVTNLWNNGGDWLCCMCAYAIQPMSCLLRFYALLHLNTNTRQMCQCIVKKNTHTNALYYSRSCTHMHTHTCTPDFDQHFASALSLHRQSARALLFEKNKNENVFNAALVFSKLKKENRKQKQIQSNWMLHCAPLKFWHIVNNIFLVIFVLQSWLLLYCRVCKPNIKKNTSYW